MRLAIWTTCLLLVASLPAAAQAPASKDAAPAPGDAGAAQGKKREACKAAAGKLRGMERADSMQVCMAEARLACVKEAVAQKMPVAKRKDFFKSCIGE